MGIKFTYKPRKKENLSIAELWEDEQTVRDTLFTVISFMRGKWGIEFCEELRFNIECNFFASANTMLDTKNNSSYKTLCKTFIAELALIVCEAQARQK
jgi:hypothetical protein